MLRPAAADDSARDLSQRMLGEACHAHITPGRSREASLGNAEPDSSMGSCTHERQMQAQLQGESLKGPGRMREPCAYHIQAFPEADSTHGNVLQVRSQGTGCMTTAMLMPAPGAAS